MRYIRDMREGNNVSDIYLCKKKQILKTKAGKTYYSLVLQDKTGTIDAKIWELNNGIANFEELDYIMINAGVTAFQGQPQLNIARLRKAQDGEYLQADYLPTSEYSLNEMYKEILALINSVENTYLKALLKHFFIEDKKFIDDFGKHSAAKAIHHSFVGGLMEHTLSVAKLCQIYADKYKILNRDLLITGALCHDIGKTRELSLFPENDYTDDGQLLGHILIGLEMIHDAVKDIPNFPPMLESELKHLIAAHHGEYEFGSPKKPALAEAFALNMADNLDAKMETLKEIFAQTDDDLEWTDYNRMLETKLRKTSK